MDNIVSCVVDEDTFWLVLSMCGLRAACTLLYRGEELVRLDC